MNHRGMAGAHANCQTVSLLFSHNEEVFNVISSSFRLIEGIKMYKLCRRI